MRKIIYTFLLIFVTQNVFPQSTLDVRFHSLPSGEVNLFNTSTNKIDTLKIINGEINFFDEIDEPTVFYFTVHNYNNSRPLTLILSNEKTEMEFNTFEKVVESGNIREIYPNQPIFKIDPNNTQLFYEFKSKWMDFYDTIGKLSTSDSKELLEKRKEVYLTFLSYCETIIKNNYDKYVSAVIIEYLIRNNLLPLETIQNFYNFLSATVKDSFFGIKIGEYSGSVGRLQPGNSAPPFEIVGLNNEKYSLGKLKGKQVLLHFWSSSCAPCIKEAPHLLKLTEENKHRLVTINISLDADEDKWRKGIDRAGLEKMINVCDFTAFGSKVVQDYAIRVLPSYYLIDENGIIILKGTLNQVSEKIKKSVP